jgi:(p)ppGpp synthase/HD superfamily hydrolase
MEELANNGIAAHWLYKKGSDYSSTISGSHKRARQWVQSLLEMQERTGNSLEFIENVKIDLFPDEVYVFTPKGKILELPHGATAIDFAYAVHTDLGSKCVGCYINRRLSSLSQPLKSGETVEIITKENAKPSPVWLDFVVTGKARSHIRHVLKGQRHNDSISLGERLLNKALNSIGSNLAAIPQEQIDALVKSTNYQSFDYILEDIGIGNRAAYITARQLAPEMEENTAGNKAGAITGNTAGTLAADNLLADVAITKQKPLVITGEEGMIMSFAKCCHPLPGDSIVGHMSSGRGIVVHTSQCPQSKKLYEKSGALIDLSWASAVKGEFVVPISVELNHQRGMVATLATKINSLDANIESISVIDIDAHTSRVDIEVSVKDRVHLARIMKHIRNLKSVSSIYRVKPQTPKRKLH